MRNNFEAREEPNAKAGEDKINQSIEKKLWITSAQFRQAVYRVATELNLSIYSTFKLILQCEGWKMHIFKWQ